MTDNDNLTITIPVNPEIRVIFKGFVISQIRHGASSAWVGALAPSVSTCHQPKILIYKIAPPPPPPLPPLPPEPEKDGQVEIIRPVVNLNEDFFLRIFPEPQAGIERFQQEPEPFIRLDERDNDRKDFRWFVDLDKVHPRPVVLDLSKIKPRFFLFRGVFHTSLRSDGEARIGALNGTSTRRFGKFASEVTARIPLCMGEQAFFFNGTSLVIPDPIIIGGGFRYDIVFDCSCQANDDEQVSDFPLIYKVITNVTDPEKIKLEPERTAKAFSPEVYCMGGNTGG